MTSHSSTPQGMRPIAGDPSFVYVLRHADDSLVLAQRMSEWISNAPELEEDIALANIGLDHLGQARALLTRAGEIEDRGRGEDQLAMFRTEREFTNLLLVEQPIGDFGVTMARSLFFDAYRLDLWEGLATSTDQTLAAIAVKARKEAAYHYRHSSTWVIRLGDGTAESHLRMQRAVDELWRFTAEMFQPDAVDQAAADSGLGIDPAGLRAQWDQRIDAVLAEATLSRPVDGHQRTGGRSGFHSHHLGHMLSEMQWLQRAYPGLSW